jgi:hypothetical protein
MWDWFVKRGWASRGLRLAQTREINPSYRLKVVQLYYSGLRILKVKLTHMLHPNPRMLNIVEVPELPRYYVIR